MGRLASHFAVSWPIGALFGIFWKPEPVSLAFGGVLKFI